MRTQVFVAVILLTVVACAPFSQEMMREVQKDVAFTDVLAAPDAFTGQSVIWGGVIIETVARADDTLVIVRQANLDFQKQPMNTDTSSGRFMIRYSGFLDPAIYTGDREVTVIGRVAGKEERPVGDFRYTYPVIESREIRLWGKRKPKSPYYYDPWYWGPYPYHPWHYRPWYRNPYWW
ncbi:MAG: Slp/YeaY family lipoprotein [Deltaproteobacteria bacterium]|jgi:outer membrane lipoprotein|nr:Slp/YeaY family lipoprotein [Deltaproteobacteria bacterium]